MAHVSLLVVHAERVSADRCGDKEHVSPALCSDGDSRIVALVRTVLVHVGPASRYWPLYSRPCATARTAIERSDARWRLSAPWRPLDLDLRDCRPQFRSN